MEWYDFFLYGIAEALVFPQLFFPGSSAYVGVLAAFGTQFVGFAARPIGAAIFGHYGDRVGRRTTLITTLMLMGVATFLIGLRSRQAGADRCQAAGGRSSGPSPARSSPLPSSGCRSRRRSTAILNITGSSTGISWYIVRCCVVAMLALILMPRREQPAADPTIVLQQNAPSVL